MVMACVVLRKLQQCFLRREMDYTSISTLIAMNMLRGVQAVVIELTSILAIPHTALSAFKRFLKEIIKYFIISFN
jgi:hypothetical protein